MEKHVFYELVDRWLDDKATPEEQRLVETFYEELSRQEGRAFTETDRQSLKAAIYTSIQDGIRIPAKLVPFHRSWPFRAAAAAVIVMLVSTATYFLLLQKAPVNIAAAPQTERFKNDIAPLTKNAILTLANGLKVVLDSTKKGSLALQGNATVSKTGEAQLVYNAAGKKPTELVYNTLTIPRGAQVVQVSLADGTKVWMNSASSLRYPTAFNGNNRTVELTGEAYFEVAKNPSMPFHVLVNGTEVEVLGTHFNIMAYEDEHAVRTTLLEGSVKITRGQSSLLISPGEQAKVDPAGEITLVKGVDIEATMAWKNGLFQFNDAGIESIMRQVSRWYDVEVEYQGNIKDLKFGAAISRKENVSRLLKFLELTGVIHFKIEGNKITVMP